MRISYFGTLEQDDLQATGQTVISRRVWLNDFQNYLAIVPIGLGVMWKIFETRQEHVFASQS